MIQFQDLNSFSLLDLFSVWAELAPEECQILRDSPSVMLVKLAIATIEVGKLDDNDSPKLLSIVQGAAQRAIFDRGLALLISQKNKRYFVAVEGFGVSGDEPTILIVRMYLYILQVQWRRHDTLAMITQEGVET